MDIIISINKPKDITSQEAVTKVKRILKVKKAGHTGILDPIATGLLLICVNRATRLMPYLSPLDKEYETTMKLGEVTDTQDAYGKIIARNDVSEIDKNAIENILKSFEGKLSQIPPMFSALKYKGKPLYKLARKGIEIERKPKEVNIHRIELLNIDLPFVSFRTLCSKGTYVRTLCHDIGKKLGVGAHLYSLVRTAIGPFNIKDSLTFEELIEISKGQTIKKGIYSMDEALSWLPELRIKDILVKTVVHGNPIKLNNKTNISNELKQARGIRIKSPDGHLLAIGSFSHVKNIIKMDVVFT